ncbi:hypothetical protein ABTY96_30820 [Streptomyces sp. NPDC096057]|uniref:hypothetical protein n=1 Tax=Streptomyces sp. NPDC096057 TaxID=3155543 RepID=UPI00331A7967
MHELPATAEPGSTGALGERGVRERVEKPYAETETPTDERNGIRGNQKNLLREVYGAHNRAARKQRETTEPPGKVGPLVA